MKSKSKIYFIISLIIVGMLFIASQYFYTGSNLPKELTYEETVFLPPIKDNIETSPSISPLATPIKKGINLAVPFSAQAPNANWDLPFQEACEETSAILVDAYFKDYDLSPEKTTVDILSLVEWQNKRFGYYFHTTAYETAAILKEYFGYKKVEVIESPTYDDIANNLRAGRPVIAPLAGRLLGNPYYRGEGPIFHMLVIKGITEDGDFITNDVGTRRGYNFVYPRERFMNALHDVKSGGDGWSSNDPVSDILSGPRRVIIVYPN